MKLLRPRGDIPEMNFYFHVAFDYFAFFSYFLLVVLTKLNNFTSSAKIRNRKFFSARALTLGDFWNDKKVKAKRKAHEKNLYLVRGRSEDDVIKPTTTTFSLSFQPSWELLVCARAAKKHQ